MNRVAPAFVLGLSLLLPACGGGGSSGGGAPSPIELTLLSSAAADGFTDSTGGGSAQQGMLIGDFDDIEQGRAYRAFLHFDLGTLPANAQIVSATLRLHQFQVIGAPYAAGFGPAVVDHVDYGPTLERTDHNVAAIQLEVGAIFSDATIGYGNLDVTSRVLVDLANASSRSQYRVRFRTMESNQDGQGNYALLEDGENHNGSGNRPQLVIRYTFP